MDATRTPAQQLRALCDVAAILHPAAPAENAARATSVQLLDRLSGASEVLQSVDDREGVDGHDGEITPLQKVEDISLWLLSRIQILLRDETCSAESASNAPPMLSMSDRVNLRRVIDFVMARTLLIATRKVQHLFATPPPYNDTDKSIHHLEETLSTILNFVNPEESTSTSTKDHAESSTMANRKPIQTITFLTFTFRTIQHLPFILSSAVLLGWCQSFPPSRFLPVRKSIIDLLEILPPSECLSTLGALLGLVTAKRRPTPKLEILDDSGISHTDPGWPLYVAQTTQVLMGKQLVRKGGVKGLMANVFGAGMGKNEVIDTFKIDHIARVVARVPVGMASESYYESVASQLTLIIRPPPKTAAFPDQYIHAACYIVCHLLVSNEQQFAGHVVPRLHLPFLPTVPVAFMDDTEAQSIQLSSSDDVEDALGLLLTLLTHAPPSVTLLRMLVSPILTQLVALSSAMSRDPTSDALTKGELEGVLRGWGRLTDEDEAVRGLVSAVTSGRGWSDRMADGRERFWAKANTGVAGFCVYFGRPSRSSHIRVDAQTTRNDHILTRASAEVPAGGGDDVDLAEALTMLRGLELNPDPDLMVRIVKGIDRPDVAAGFMISLLGIYQTAVQVKRSGMETVTYLQIILHLAQELGSSIFNKPDQILVFVEEALRPNAGVGDMETKHHTKALDRRRDGRDPDSDDEDEPELQNPISDGTSDAENNANSMGMIDTAISLFLAVLAGNEKLSVASNPLLLPIERHLQSLSRNASITTKQAADQALLLLSVRKAMPKEQSAASEASKSDSTTQKYREALKLLSDPLLPVRGHGLIMLQDVVKAKDFDRALVPGILDIFMRSIEDDDSFMYLNAVKGLSSMVDGIGKDVFRKVVNMYCGGLKIAATLSSSELDRRLRYGEALVQSIRRCGEAFGAYANVVVPPVAAIFPLSHLPTALRTSSLSILAACADSDWKSLIPWCDDLVSACVDLVQLESVPMLRERAKEKNRSQSGDKTMLEETTKYSVPEPIKANDSKHPALRRAALVFLGVVLDAVARSVLESLEQSARTPSEPIIRVAHTQERGSSSIDPQRSEPPLIDLRILKRARTVIQYVESTDEDDLVRHQAMEVIGILDSVAYTGVSTS